MHDYLFALHQIHLAVCAILRTRNINKFKSDLTTKPHRKNEADSYDASSLTTYTSTGKLLLVSYLHTLELLLINIRCCPRGIARPSPFPPSRISNPYIR